MTLGGQRAKVIHQAGASEWRLFYQLMMFWLTHLEVSSPSPPQPPTPGISFEVLNSLRRLGVGKLRGTRDLEAWRSQARGFSIQSCLGLHVPVPGPPDRALVPAIKGREQKILMLTLGWVLGLISHKPSSAPAQLSDLG